MQPIIELKSELEGIIKLEIIKEDGTLKEASGLNVPFYNLITNAGLDYVSGYSTVQTAMNYCCVGTSSTPPTVFDTTLGAQTGSASPAGTATNSIQYTTTPYYSEHKKVYTFSSGAISGNLTEVGFFSASSGGTMWSRALIKDSGGNPTTLTLLATEQLKVTYTVRRYIPASLTGSFTLNKNGTNSTINYTITPANLSNSDSSHPFYNGSCGDNGTILYLYETATLGGIMSRPTGNPTAQLSFTAAAYTSGSFYRNLSVAVATSTANFATGIGSFIFWDTSYTGYDYCGYQCSFSPKIMKTSSQTLTINVRISWGRTTQQ